MTYNNKISTKVISLLFILSHILYAYGQEKSFTINWEGSKIIQTTKGKREIPAFEEKHQNYSEESGLIFHSYWDIPSAIDESSITINNVSYQIINLNELKDLNIKTIPNQLEFKFYNTTSRRKVRGHIELSPIVKDNGSYKKVTSFNINHNNKQRTNANINNISQAITNSVLSSGQWYRFSIDRTGIFRLSKDFLSSLGINTDAVDPRTIKIYGNGGRMLPLINSATNQFIDPIENPIRFVGEDDGRFDNEDYILFYGEGPDQYNDESETNINLYTDVIYYYVNVSNGNGKRVPNAPSITAPANISITTFEDYQFYEVDEFNLAKIGRRWFGDDFDVENQRTYEFNFPNIVTNIPVDVNINVGAISSTQTSMSISVNGDINTLSLDENDPENRSGSILASSNAFNGSINSNSETITVVLDYNNNGNPSANAFLDFITIEATRDLTYENNQLIFKNSIVTTTPGIAEYTLSNASNIDETWDISDRFNIVSYVNNNESNFIFKALSGSEKTYLAFSHSDAFQPEIVGTTTLTNQNLKGTIFNNEQGAFEDIDYIIIAPSNLLTQAERLAQINREQYNLVVKVVELEKIYNEFSTGNQDIAAIRNFVRYVYDNASSNANLLKYLCLFGDGSYDYKDRIPNNTNIMPSWYSIDRSTNSTHNQIFNLAQSFVSDDFFGSLDEGEGSMDNSDDLDIAIGRILADSPQRAKEMVDKIEAYYAQESFGKWRNNVMLISDDVDEEGEESLQETTENLARTLEVEKPFFNVNRIHTDAFQQEASSGGERYPEVNEAIINNMEVGALVVNYFGHGGEDGLAVERIFDRFESQELNNICRFNLFVTVTCEYTKFDDPERETAGEFMFWNTNGGSIGLITTTRQIFINVGVSYNQALDEYLFAFDSNDYPSIAEALRLTKNLSPISTAISNQKRLAFFIGDPAMKLAVPRPNIRLTKVNDVDIATSTELLSSLSRAKLEGDVTDENNNVLSNYNGVISVTVYDKNINRQTLGNDNITNNDGLILLDFTTLGETLFNGQATVTNGKFEVEFIVPRDINVAEGNGKISFYSKENNALIDQAGANFDVRIGGINENAPEDNTPPIINAFMNDENFVSGGITNESPTLLMKLQDESGINTASGIGHDITAILDGDETNPFVLNDYYQSNIDDFTNGSLTFPFRDLEPGLHTLTLKAWDVYNNSSTSEVQFIVFNENEDLVIDNVLNYPNPFVNYTEFWFNHNSSDILDISVQIFTVSGKLVRTLNGQTTNGGKTTSSLSRDIVWDGRDDFGGKLGKGVYIYKLKVKSNRLNRQVEKIQKLVIL